MAKNEKGLRLSILGDLIADIGMRLTKFPVQARDIHRLSYMEVGPGGACNVAIMAARFGVQVGALGEVGDDGFGLVVREGLRREGVDVEHLLVSRGAHTPVAGVVVDEASEPGYLGYPGSLQERSMRPDWQAAIRSGQAFFADGWAEYAETPVLVMDGFAAARGAGVPTFFDPGPGNPDIDNGWHLEAIAHSTVVLMNRREALRLTGLSDDEAVVLALQKLGAELVLLKRGEEGLLAARVERVQAPGLDVEAKDATGAGDSVAGAMIYGVLHGLPLQKLAVLANATGAAKVQNIGTGHNMPSLQQIAVVLRDNGFDPQDYFETPDGFNKLLADLRTGGMAGLANIPGFVYPRYEGQSFLNIPSRISNWLGAGPFVAPQLRADITAPFAREWQRVVFVLVDALAYHRLQAWLQEPQFAPLAALAGGGVLAPLTSIAPSTTCAALTSFWTGAPPALHGTVGYELWLREYGLVANMIFHAPFSFERQPGSLHHAGFDAAGALGLPTLGTHLAAAGVRTYAFQHDSIIDSGLSNMFFADVTRNAFQTPADLWASVHQHLQAHAGERAFYWVYWGDADYLSHKLGPDDASIKAEFASFVASLQENFLGPLSPELRKDTLFILGADHGQVHTEKDPHYDLRNHPQLLRRLHMNPTGENRMAYLYVRPGQMEAVREYIERTWPQQFVVLESAYAAEQGLLGPGPHSPKLADRMGDLTVIPRNNAFWWWGVKENPLLGRHGGLMEQEMVVPFLAAAL